MLVEPLTVSCDLLAAVAPWTCRGADGDRCDWYHGSWQYLRLLDLVSNPTWHSSYLLDTLRTLFSGRCQVRVLVSGCADYSTYAHVVAALGGRAAVTALDWCPTPLIATEWYARQAGQPAPRTVVADAVGFVERGSYDLIISDSFLPRFSDSDRSCLLRSWRASLRDDGAALTTVRVHDRPGHLGQAGRSSSQAVSWQEVAESKRSWWPTVSATTADEMVKRVSRFAEKQERNAVYDVERVRGAFAGAGFARTDIDTSVRNGKLFARVVALPG